MADIDHLVYFVPDLDAAVDAAVHDYGVRPEFGGRHPGRGTHNALLALGDAYLELIAPDPSQPAPDGPRPFGIDDLTEPAFVAYAVRPSDGEHLDDLIAALAGVGADPGPATAMSRATPTGDRLEWRLTFPDPTFDGAVPFLIDWGTTPQPHRTAPAGPTLRSLTVATNHGDVARAAVAALGLTGRVHVTDADIDTDRGTTITPHLDT